MALFDRKKEVKEKGSVLPELPELPNLSDSNQSDFEDVTMSEPYEFPDSNKEIKELPSFPDSDFGDSLSQEAVKSAIKTPERKLTMDFSEHNSNEFITPEEKTVQGPPEIMNTESFEPNAQTRVIKEPVYIRIDKFKFAIDGFEEIKEKIGEVEKYLQKIREQKRREDEEMHEWEKEIEAIKTRIESIDNKIFSKL